MHYPDEPYVRKYHRRTLTWHKLGWEGRAVKDAMLGEFDRAGIFDIDGDDVAECVALVTGIPIEVVRIGLERLLKTKTFTLTDGGPLVWPNYVEAQTCAKSDKARQAESRARRAEKAASSTDPVTLGHEPSRDVTPNLAMPNPTELISSEQESKVFEGELVEPEAESRVEPKSTPPRGRRRRRDRPEGYWQFPKGWRWSSATAAAAAREGIAAAELRDHVIYWTTRMWSSEVTDLDGELVRSFAGIKERRASKLVAAPNAPANPYAWAPTQEHRAFAKSKGLPLDVAVAAYRASGRPDAIGTLPASDDFMRRLRSWAETGEFRPIGPLPRLEAARGAA